MTQSIDRIAQLFEVRKPKHPAIVAPFDGIIGFIEKGRLRYMTVTSDYQKTTYLIKDGYKTTIKKGIQLEKGSVYATKGKSNLKVKEAGTVLEVNTDHIILGIQDTFTSLLTGISPLKTEPGQRVYK
jgi:hypothetical protein